VLLPAVIAAGSAIERRRRARTVAPAGGVR
jgi:hypothetical protein